MNPTDIRTFNRRSRQGLLLGLWTLLSVAPARGGDEPRVDPCAVIMAPHAGNAAADRDIVSRQAKVAAGVDRAAHLERLGWAFVSKARSSHDPGFFVLARQAALCIRRGDPESVDATFLEAYALHNLHHFAEATVLARSLVAKRSRWFDHALLGDVLMEQGDLAGAVVSYQRAMDLRPGPQVYSRAAHVRWLKGDVNGAVAMMRAAANSVNGRDLESAAWTRSRLALYELQRARFEAALQWADSALTLQPDFAPALFARGRTLLARGETHAAVASLTAANDHNPLPDYQWALAEALAADRRDDEARRLEATLVANGGANDPRTLALFLATRRESTDAAVRLARRELTARQDVFTYDALAWALLAAGHVDPAYASMRRAVAEGTEDARIFFHAAAIAAAAGQSTEAEQWRQRALRLAHMLLPSEHTQLLKLEETTTDEHAYAKEEMP